MSIVTLKELLNEVENRKIVVGAFSVGNYGKFKIRRLIYEIH